MILTITPNPALDLTYRVGELRPGHSHRTEAPLAKAGGKGVNVARVAAEQGFAALALITAGGETGELLLSELRGSRLPHRAVHVSAETRRSIALVSDAGDATLLNEVGTALTEPERERLCAAAAEESTSASVVAISGSMPPGADVLERLISSVRPGTPLIVDTSGPALRTAASAGADVLKPNHIELADATGELDPVAGAMQLIALGATLVVVSLGSAGMVAVSGARPPLTARLQHPLQGNPTGAGDAAVAAIAATLADTPLAEVVRAPETMLRRAVAWSAAAVLMPTAGEISNTHAEIFRQVTITPFHRTEEVT